VAETRPADAEWKRRIDQLIGQRSVGMAVGIGGRIVYAHSARRPRVPASNEKLLLSMALFDYLGPAFRIPTSVAANRGSGVVVEGDLWLLGHGDPTLTKHQPSFWGSLHATTLAGLAARIKAAGIRRVGGRIMGATGYFAHDLQTPGWRPYVPGRYVQLPASLSLNGNFTVRGKPERAAAQALTRELERVGVSVEDPAGTGKPPAGLHRVAAVRSVPLRDLVAFTDKTSNNFFAEMLGKLLGAVIYGPPGTIHKGARAVETWVRSQDVEAATYDSSGLSYKNRISAHGMVKLLAAAETRSWGKVLRAGLPGPGEGTLAYRLAGLDVRAKTGTLFNGDSALSGWIRPARSRTWVEFSILDRGIAKTIEDRIVTVLSQAHMASEIHAGRKGRLGAPLPQPCLR
jgi:D-alanyl-D-alanine carboxypeptidase/D-alanyl-D-alanine-endopeptidase (penicillin-binding protein 4)